MGKASEFKSILDECLERVVRGEDVEACLAQYPQHAAELEPLLRTALAARKAVAIKPRPEFRQRAGYEFQAAVRDMQPGRGGGFFRWQVRWMAPVAIVLVVLVAGSGTVAAASSSLPDEPLYQVKLATEAVRLAFTPSELGKAELYARFADMRVEEIVRLADKGKLDQVEKTTDRMNNQLLAMADLTVSTGRLSGESPVAMLQAPAPSVGEAAEAQTKQAPVAAPAPAAETAPLPREDTNVVQEPAPVISAAPSQTEPSALAEAAPAATVEDAGRGKAPKVKEQAGKPAKQAKLKTILSRKSIENLQKLKDELEKAPESLKPALKRAIEVITDGYETNLGNLEREK